jgi:1,2-phenylacetyl-CoA epoxidase catalytic subunit
MTPAVSTDTEYDSIADLAADAATGLRNVLLACADTKLLLGYHYGEWTFGPPELEAAVANCSLSQTELGHVRLLHAVLKKHFGDDPDRLVDDRDAAAFANVSFLDTDLPDWPAYVGANFIVDVTMTRVLHAMRGSAFKPLRMSLDKMIDEERYHAHHGTGWFRTVAQRGDEERALLAARSQEALDSVIEWLGPPGDPGDGALVDARIKGRSNTDIRDAMLEELIATAGPLGLDLKVRIPDDWQGWNPATRRRTSDGPNADILYHLRGGGNTIFKLA